MMPDLSSFSAQLEMARLLDKRSFAKLIRRTALSLAIALGVPLLVFIGLIVHLVASARWVDHSDQVVAKASQLSSRLLLMQSNFRGFRLSGQLDYLQTAWQQRQEADNVYAGLTDLVKDNPTQRQRVAQLNEFKMRWYSFLDREIAAVRANPKLLSDPAFLKTGVPLFDAVHEQIQQVVEEEARLRKERDRYLHGVIAGLAILLGLALVVGVPVFTLWMMRMLRRSSVAYSQSLSVAEYRAKGLQVTLSSIGDAVITTDAQGRVNFLNPAAETATEWSNADATGQELSQVFAIFNESTGLIVENPVERVLREKIVVGLANHTILRSRNGREIPIEDSAAPILGENGEILGVVLVFHDVTEKRATERERLAVEKRTGFFYEFGEATRSLLETREIMSVSSRLLGEYLEVSRCAYALMEPDGERFTIVDDYVNGCSTTAGAYQLSNFGEGAAGAMHRGETLVIRHVSQEIESGGGREMFQAIDVEAIVCCPLIISGQFRAMMAVHQTRPRDWTQAEILLVQEVVERCWATIERQRAEAESRSRTERLRLCSEVVAVQFWTASPTGELNFVNTGCLTYFGLSRPEDLFGNVWVSFVHPDDAPGGGKLWQESLASGTDYEVEFRIRRHDGAYRWFVVRAKALLDDHGRPATWFGTNTDVHDLKMAQRDAEIASQKKDDFLAALSHELRTPLTPVLLCTSSLIDEPNLSEDVLEQLRMMERNITLEARLIDDLLDVTSISQGKLQLHTEPCDAHLLIAHALEIVKKDSLAKHIVITCDYLATRHEIVFDPARFQQVVWNLLRNAVKFTPEQGRISIRTTDLDEDFLQIEVTDTGIGIAPNLLQQIFAPFEQGTLTGNHLFGGLGLGLAIARAIVQALGGSIQADSDGPGRGATFSIKLPATLSGKPKRSSLPSLPATTPTRRRRNPSPPRNPGYASCSSKTTNPPSPSCPDYSPATAIASSPPTPPRPPWIAPRERHLISSSPTSACPISLASSSWSDSATSINSRASPSAATAWSRTSNVPGRQASSSTCSNPLISQSFARLSTHFPKSLKALLQLRPSEPSSGAPLEPCETPASCANGRP